MSAAEIQAKIEKVKQATRDAFIEYMNGHLPPAVRAAILFQIEAGMEISFTAEHAGQVHSQKMPLKELLLSALTAPPAVGTC